MNEIYHRQRKKIDTTTLNNATIVIIYHYTYTYSNKSITNTTPTMNSTTRIPPAAKNRSCMSVQSRIRIHLLHQKFLFCTTTMMMMMMMIMLPMLPSCLSPFPLFVHAAYETNNNNNNNNNSNHLFSEQKEQLKSFTNDNVLEPIKHQYEQLSPNGKFLSTAFAGFTSSRLVIRTTVKTTLKIAKVTGAAFIVWVLTCVCVLCVYCLCLCLCLCRLPTHFILFSNNILLTHHTSFIIHNSSYIIHHTTSPQQIWSITLCRYIRPINNHRWIWWHYTTSQNQSHRKS